MLPRYHGEQDLRKWQIDTLKIFNDHVVVIKENSEYRVEFPAAGINMSLDVILTPDFPNEKPAIFVNPPIVHSWVMENSNQIVGAPGLLNFTVHSDLGRVVQAIIRELQKTVPHLNNYDKKQNSPKTHVVSTQILAFPELKDLTIEELQEILDNTDLQDKFLENNQQLVELDLETEEVMGRIEQIAKDNISKQQTLDDLKTEVIDRISTIVQLKMNYEELNQKYQKLAATYDPHKIRDCLKAAAVKADEDADGIAEEFLLGNISVETFISKFAEKRAFGQATRAREERLAHQLTQLELATSKLQ